MMLFKIDSQNRGFTLIEMIVVVMILGILSSLAIPSFFAMNSRAKLNRGLTDVSSSLQEIQRTAIRTHKTCTATLSPNGSNNPNLNSPCLINGNLLLDSFKIRTDITSIIFNERGDTSTSTTTRGTVILSLPDGNKEEKCLIISPGIGLIRTGNYDPADPTGVDASKCSSVQ